MTDIGVPYSEPKVLCSEITRFYVLKVLRSDGSTFRRFYVPKVLCSEGSTFRRFYVPKVLCSEGSMFRKTEGSIWRCLYYVPKFQIVHPVESGVSVRRLTGWMNIGILRYGTKSILWGKPCFSTMAP